MQKLSFNLGAVPIEIQWKYDIRIFKYPHENVILLKS